MTNIVRLNELPEGSGNLSSDDIFVFMDDPSGSAITKKISLSEISAAIGGNPFDQDLNTTNFPQFSGVSLSNGTTLAQGTFDNSTGGNNGISLNCYVGYELNWQGGHLKSTTDGGLTSSNIWCDSPIEFPGSGTYSVKVDNEGIRFVDGSVQKSKHPTVIQLGNASGTINTNASLGDIFDINLMGSGTLATPSNPTDGQSLRWRITHKADNIPFVLGSGFNVPSSATSPLPFSSTSGTMDLLAATYDLDRNKWDVIAFIMGY